MFLFEKDLKFVVLSTHKVPHYPYGVIQKDLSQSNSDAGD
jgi:hypothetical protein